jgi:preprotein translocase subunit SecA
VIEYKNEAFRAFAEMMAGIEEEALEMFLSCSPPGPNVLRRFSTAVPAAWSIRKCRHSSIPRPPNPLQLSPAAQPQVTASVTAQGGQPAGHPRSGATILVPCGSGKKFKKCCGQNS